LPIILAYHGCTKEAARQLLGGSSFRPSENKYDWLGSGSYFWEWDYARAYEWAKQSRITGDASVVGAAVELGNCLDLTTIGGIQAVDAAYKDFAAKMENLGESLPENKDLKDREPGNLALRFLDRAVITHLHESLKKAGIRDYDTLRALFPEGRELYTGAGFWERTHVQLAVRTQESIHGVFRVPQFQLKRAGIPLDIYDDASAGY
jgi:hypothetical protein